MGVCVKIFFLTHVDKVCNPLCNENYLLRIVCFLVRTNMAQTVIRLFSELRL